MSAENHKEEVEDSIEDDDDQLTTESEVDSTDEPVTESSLSSSESESEEDRKQMKTTKKRKKAKEPKKQSKRAGKKRIKRERAKMELSIPMYHVGKVIEVFDGNVGTWPTFKRQVESLVISRNKESEDLKRSVILGLLKGEAKGIWSRAMNTKEKLMKSWTRLAKVFEDPKRIDVFITHSVLEMPQVQDKYDKQNLQSILDQLTEFLNALGTFGDQHTLNQSRMIYDIAAKFWCEEADRMGAKYKTLEKLLIRVRKLYQNAISYEHRRKTSKGGTETEKPKTNKTRYVSVANLQTTKGFKRSATVNWVQGPTGQHIGAFTAYIGTQRCEVLIDSGAEVSVINAKIVPRANLKKVAPIWLLGFETRMISVIDMKAEIVLIHPEGQIQLEAYVSDHVPNSRLIVGQDHIAKLFKKGHRVWHTIFGDIDLESMKVINVASKLSVPWNEWEEPEKEDQTKLAMQIERLGNGRFQVALPFFSARRPKDNLHKVINHLDRLQFRLVQSGLFEQYEEELMKFVHSNYAEIIQEKDGYFLPHREIIRPNATSTKFRIVLNASFGYDALNQMLWKGTAHGLNALPHILRIRMGKFLVMADLQQAFLQIIIRKEDRRFLRFIWRKKNGQIVFMQMVVLPFGVISAPAILTETIQLIVKGMTARTQSIVKNSTYMDDMLAINDSEKDLWESITEAKIEFAEAGFHLHKINSNSTLIRKAFNVVSQENNMLGLNWDCIEDRIRLNWHSINPIRTRRELLRFIGQCYDPMGIAEPIKLPLRLIYSDLLALEWDQKLDEEDIRNIENTRLHFSKINDVRLPRHVKGSNLMCFVDACLTGYGYVIYLDQHIIFGKSKISPKRRTIVELELLALSEGVKALSRLIPLLLFDQVLVFSDSQVNIERLKKSPNDFPVDADARPQGLIEQRGLLHFSSRDVNYRPIWIPRGTHLAEVILIEAHRKSLHRGVHMTLAMISDGIRVSGAERHLKRIIKNCTLCRAIRGKIINQPLGMLHDNQKRFVQPFEDVVTDMFGPLILANGSKCYGVIVVCRSTKAAKLFVIENQSEEALYSALSSIWGQVGWPIRIHSDNGTNFLAVRAKLLKVIDPGVEPMTWTLSTPYGPWMNGVAERIIRLTKECLSRFRIASRSLFLLQKRFLLVEQVINARPILQEEGRFLSAFELAQGRTPKLSSTGVVDAPIERRNAYSKRVEEIGKLWIAKFVRQQRKITREEAADVRINDWVMVPKAMGKRAHWPVAQVIEMKRGSDNVCRSVKIRCEAKEYWRPTNGLVWIGRSPGGAETIQTKPPSFMNNHREENESSVLAS
ncbi:hypothetical protein BLOT_009774 [Blomia tropicalis]|nr:hypothetical protein BLOT_009774 [Blomia tropicalis]